MPTCLQNCGGNGPCYVMLGFASSRLLTTAYGVPHFQCSTSHAVSQGLHWMVEREQKRDALGRGILHLHPVWVQLVTQSGYTFYVNRCVRHAHQNFSAEHATHGSQERHTDTQEETEVWHGVLWLALPYG